jgi:predicted PurR-regulated permease PerM
MLSDSARKKAEFLISVLCIAVVAVIIYASYRFVGIILPFVIAFVLAAMLRPLIRWLNKKL